MNPKCDWYAGCTFTPTLECRCSRCMREPPCERFYSCGNPEHEEAARKKHDQIRGTLGEWWPHRDFGLAMPAPNSTSVDPLSEHLHERIKLLQIALQDIIDHVVANGTWARERAAVAQRDYRELCARQKKS